ncbi:MAG TPA: DeoR/GlpR family DNA-binding transcription regulator [Thermoleophilia bacterium]|nr:DeoR/GlpR family DNA-binding transcription regulator [Thermoleophilia bacterium]
MRQEERLSLILEELASGGSVGVAQLAAKLHVSTASIRRDLHTLEEQRLLTRTHGGAMANSTVYELPLRYRGGRHRDAKRRIAATAAARVDGHVASVALTGGTTTTEVARELAGRKDITVVTNALNIAAELALRPELKLIVTGGTARSESYELVGPIAEAALSGMNLDLAIVGVDGVSVSGGLTTYHDIEAHTNEVLISRARRVIVVADASKVGKLAFVRICALEAVDELITDVSAPAAELRALAEAGVTVTTV